MIWTIPHLPPHKLFPPQFLLILTFIYSSLFFWRLQPLVNSDLGRHLKNGQLILTTGQIPRTNLYSYTYPNFPVVTHHWLSGVIFYIIYTAADYIGLHLVYISINLFTIFTCLRLALKKASLPITSLSLLIATPLITDRILIRPEVFSYLFLCIFIFILESIKFQQISPKWLLALPLFELIWVNTHIYFFLSFLVVGIYLLDSVIFPNKVLSRQLAIVFISLIFASFFNPFGFRGFLAPFNLFKNYGYQIGENQNIFEYINHLPHPPYFIFLSVTFYLLLIIFRHRHQLLSRHWFLPSLFLVGFSLAGVTMVRNVSPAGYVFLIFFPQLIANHLRAAHSKIMVKLNRLSYIFLLSIVVCGFILPHHFFSPLSKDFGLGLEKQSAQSLNWITNNSNIITGPIFNNFDIGGFLDWSIYPRQRVFVDNRPEAYPSDFFSNVYIKAQQNDLVWRQLDHQYQFQTIIFSTQDLTPWAKPFITRRLNDPIWQLAYQDARMIVLTRSL